MVLKSFAKLNLYLAVLNKRTDNYHNIKTLFERIDLSDKIILKPRSDNSIKIICKNKDCPPDSSNLCYCAAKLLQEGFNINQGVDITIVKRIPVGAGLAGGSSNAAAVFLGLNRLWKLGLSQEKLAKLAQKIGCDVPFFIYNTSFCWGGSRGDKIKPLKLLKTLRLWHILVVPKINVSTAQIYKEWDRFSALTNIKGAGLTPAPIVSKKSLPNRKLVWGLTSQKPDVKILILALHKNDRSLIEEALFNSLEEITIRLYPEVRRIKEELSNLGLKSILMSGSGPAVFGVVSSRKEACGIRRKLKKQHRSWQVFVTRTI